MHVSVNDFIGVTTKPEPLGYICHMSLSGTLIWTQFLQLDDVRVTEQLEILYLPAYLAHHIEALDFVTVQYFDGHLVPCQLMLSDCTTHTGQHHWHYVN